ncbi:thiosulfate:glutathione sulfurtransferase isoform X2 [Boleophthalmus pectinirostris]|uniref:thiosulfate:glutathione sulfurtransferase isoform X2 n=1 Tax=Boleophthalmus pectinirostris TaxID=150288 RepID=UPI00242CCC83|nr:thiosulfate:glutathione sulfurtransferase isoform X2 [Boleophthalmus pectinirostris]
MDVVTVAQLKSMLTSKNVQLFDVRRPDEFQAGHIPTAVNIPLDGLEVSLNLPSEKFEQTFHVKAPAKEDDNIVFSCRSGVRSGQALDIARHLGFSKARHLQGGYLEWEAEAKEKSS